MKTRAVKGLAAEQRGRRAETAAVWALRLKGYRILARRHAFKRGMGAGEVDLIARRGRILAFVEIKARPDMARGMESLTIAQRRRLARAAEVFLAQNPDLTGLNCRFDLVVAVPGRWPRHIPDAWRPDF